MMGPLDGIYRDRVRDHTASPVNAKIDEKTEANIRQYTREQVAHISRRLAALDAEWDVDRALMLNFAVVGGTALAIGHKRPAFRLLLAAQLTFLAVHALVGWCPPVPVLRRLGFRTQKEINVERRALMDTLDARLPA